MSVARTERSDIRALASPAQSFCDVDAGAPVGDVGGVLAVEVVVCFRDRLKISLRRWLPRVASGVGWKEPRGLSRRLANWGNAAPSCFPRSRGISRRIRSHLHERSWG